MPGAASKLWSRLGLPGSPEEERLPNAGAWGLLEPGTTTRRGEALFPRLED
jgi:methionyl-tRNA synthetase